MIARIIQWIRQGGRRYPQSTSPFGGTLGNNVGGIVTVPAEVAAQFYTGVSAVARVFKGTSQVETVFTGVSAVARVFTGGTPHG
jgi:hypothetical protein